MYAKWIPALENELEEADEWNGLSLGTRTLTHEFEYITKMVYYTNNAH